MTSGLSSRDRASITPDGPRRAAILDAIRGAAILQVLVWHYLVELPLWPPLAHALSLTWSGVDLFFVLSGYLIGGMLLDNEAAPNYYTAFYGRRLFRILPLYLLSLIGFVWLRHHLAWPGSERLVVLFNNPGPPWAYATFTQNIIWALTGDWGPHWTGITWSLAVEEQFYLCLPLLIRNVPRRARLLTFAAIALAAPLARWLFYGLPTVGPFAAYLLLPCRVDALFLGVMAAWLVRNPTALRWIETRRARLAILLALGGLGTVGMILAGWQVLDRPMSLLGYSWIDATYFLLLLLLVTMPRAEAWAASAGKPLCALGIGAYAIYLFHRPVLGLVEGLWLDPSLISRAIATVLTLGLAALCWFGIERPLIRFARTRFRYGLPRADRVVMPVP